VPLLATTAAEAVDATRRWVPDLVVLDLDLDGPPVEKLVRELPVPPTRVILLRGPAGDLTLDVRTWHRLVP